MGQTQNDQSAGGLPEQITKAISSPDKLLSRIGSFKNEIKHSYKLLIQSLEDWQTEVQDIGKLAEISNIAQNMLEGKIDNTIDGEAKGEIGSLITAINTTLSNLRQLDKTIQNETGKMPQLALYLDNITEETESATTQVLEKLDLMMETSENQTNFLDRLIEISNDLNQMESTADQKINDFLIHIETLDKETALTEAVDFIKSMKIRTENRITKSHAVNQEINKTKESAAALLDLTFEIMNLLQFQDITRQKVSKIIILLKEMQRGLYRLCSIFNIQTDQESNLITDEVEQTTQNKIMDHDALTTDAHIDSVDEIMKSLGK